MAEIKVCTYMWSLVSYLCRTTVFEIFDDLMLMTVTFIISTVCSIQSTHIDQSPVHKILQTT